MNDLSAPALHELRPLIDALASELDHFRLDHSLRPLLREKAAALAVGLGSLDKRDRQRPELPEIQELARCVWNAGYLSQPVSDADLALANSLREKGWGGLMGAMLVAPCWQWAEAPTLNQVPDWLWSHFIDWAFISPCAATAVGAADLHVRKLEVLTEDVLAWSRRNIGAACVVEAITAVARHRTVSSPVRSTLSLKRLNTARIGLWTTSLRERKSDGGTFAATRGDRALHIGILRRDWSESASVRTLLPRLTALDPNRFTLHLFAERLAGDALEGACRQLATDFRLLPGSSLEGIEALRLENLDVLIFAGGMTTTWERDFAHHRIAPLQIVTDECPYATGLDEIDLHLTNDEESAREFNEKLGLLSGPATVWDDQSGLATPPPATREILGLPPVGPVLACAAPIDCYSPEIFRAWKALLRSNSSATLLLIPPVGTDSFALEQLFHRLQATSGIEDSRFVISIGDPRPALAVADVYLDTYPYSSPATLAAALSASVPAVAWTGESHRSRLGARTLESYGQSSRIATDLEGYIDLVQRLVSDEVHRMGVRKNLEAAIERRRGMGDPVRESHAFGDLINAAFDRLASNRPLPDILRVPTPEFAASEIATMTELALSAGESAEAISQACALLRWVPDSTEARSLLGRGYLLGGQHAQAVACFMSALRSPEKNPRDWLCLGAALRGQKEFGMAITAYKNGLRLEPANIEGWIAIAEIAREAGVKDLVQDAIGVARQININDPRLAAFAA